METVIETNAFYRGAKEIGIDRSTVFMHKGADEEFALAWEDAIEAYYDNVEEIATKRATEGWEQEVYYEGG